MVMKAEERQVVTHRLSKEIKHCRRLTPDPVREREEQFPKREILWASGRAAGVKE